MENEKLSPYLQGVITAELLWQSLMPHIPPPHRKFIGTWLHHYTFAQISDGLEQTARHCEHKHITDTDIAGKIASRNMRKKYGNNEDNSIRALHFS